MRPRDVSSALCALLPTRRPVYLWGPPGVGKSAVVKQAADALKLALVDVRATLLDPVDLRGPPRVTGDRHHAVPACVVCLTDRDARFPDRPPAVPVLWAVVGDTTTDPPFVRRVRVGG